jgi:hypothetical protein
LVGSDFSAYGKARARTLGGFPTHRPGGRHAAGQGGFQDKRLRLCQPGRPAIPCNLHQSPAPGRLRFKLEGKRRLLFAGDFVLHSLRHTMLSRLGESGVDAFTIMRIAGHSSIVVSQRYIHPAPEAVEWEFERLQLSAVNAETGPTTATRHSIRYTGGSSCRKSLKGL